MVPFRTHKQRPVYLEPVEQTKEFPRFEPIPTPPPAETRFTLSTVLGSTAIAQIVAAGQITFHSVGDTGGVNGTVAQEGVAAAMEAQIPTGAAPGVAPAFLYILGDVVYYNGLSYLYNSQFYEPYKYYPAPILAIAGNHDGDTHTYPNDPVDNEPSLHGFFLNFCDTQRRPVDAYRDTMAQPYVYWTLQAPFVTIIGLYGNVDGSLDAAGEATQQQWLTAQLQQADPNACLIVAVHQPPYSLDTAHGGYRPILDAIDSAAATVGRWPDAVLSGHVHNYQRYTRTVSIATGERQIPYIVAGAGGYANTQPALHKMQRDPNGAASTPLPCPVQTGEPGVWLRGYNERATGFLRLTVTDTRLTATYFAVPFSGAPATTPFDSVTVNYRTAMIESEMNPGTSGAD